MIKIIDDFEDGNLNEYEHDTTRDGRASIVSSPTHSGSNALSISNENAELISTSGLDNYPTAGDTFSCWLRATGGADDMNLSYGVQGHKNRYLVRIDFADDNLRIWRIENDTAYTLNAQTSGFSLSEDTWYEVEVDWGSGGTHTATLYEGGGQLAQVSTSDSTWTSGGIGYDAYLGSGGTVYIDDVVNASGNSGGGGGSTDSDIIDDFEDGNLSEYEFDRGVANVVSSPTLSGTQALEISGTNAELISTSGLNTYPSQGEIFNYWVRGTGGADKLNLTYGVQDHDNRYLVRVDFNNNRFALYRYENANGTLITEDDSGFVVPEDQWLRVEVYWQTDGMHELTLFDSGSNVLSRITGTDSTWTSGGVGYDAYLSSSGGSVYFDSIYRYRPDYTPNSGPAVIDNFEDGNLDEWGVGGTTDNAEIVSNPTQGSSSFAVKLSGDVSITSEKGLTNYPSAGDTFSVWVRGKSNSGIGSGSKAASLAYGSGGDAEDYYAVYLYFENNEIDLTKWSNGSSTDLTDGTCSEINYDEWYRIEVNWGIAGHHWIGVYNEAGDILGRIHAIDNTYKSGGIALWTNTGEGGTFYYDSLIQPKSDGSDGNFGA